MKSKRQKRTYYKTQEKKQAYLDSLKRPAVYDKDTFLRTFSDEKDEKTKESERDKMQSLLSALPIVNRKQRKQLVKQYNIPEFLIPKISKVDNEARTKPQSQQ